MDTFLGITIGTAAGLGLVRLLVAWGNIAVRDAVGSTRRPSQHHPHEPAA